MQCEESTEVYKPRQGEILSLIPDDPKHDVVLKCKNGRLHRPVDDIFVIIRIDIEQDDADAHAIAYSYDVQFGSQFVEQIACRELYGRFWDHEKEGTPCFDPYDDEGKMRPLPRGRFMMWDDDGSSEDDAATGLPKVSTPSLTIYDKGPEHRPIKRYKVSKVQLTIQDLISIETDGDRFFKQ